MTPLSLETFGFDPDFGGLLLSKKIKCPDLHLIRSLVVYEERP